MIVILHVVNLTLCLTYASSKSKICYKIVFISCIMKFSILQTKYSYYVANGESKSIV